MLWYVIIVLYIFMSCWTIVIALTSWCYFDFVLIYTNSILHISMCVCLILLLLTDVSICYHMVFHWISRMSDRNNLIRIAVLWLSKYCRVRCQSWIEEKKWKNFSRPLCSMKTVSYFCCIEKKPKFFSEAHARGRTFERVKLVGTYISIKKTVVFTAF